MFKNLLIPLIIWVPILVTWVEADTSIQVQWKHFLMEDTIWDGGPREHEALSYDPIQGSLLSTTHRIWVSMDSIEQYRNQPSSFPSYISVNDSGHIWQSGTWSGLHEYRDSIWYDHTDWDTQNAGITQAQVGPDGLLWYTISFGKGTYAHDGVQDTLMHAFDPSVIRQDSDGNIWLAGTGHNANNAELYQYDGSSWTYYDIPEYASVPYSISDVAVDSLGQVWISTYPLNVPDSNQGPGLMMMDTQGNWSSIGVQDGLHSSDIYDIQLTDQDRIWLATSQGVSYQTDSAWVHFGSEAWGVDSSLYESQLVHQIIYTPGGEICLATRGIHCTDMVAGLQPLSSIQQPQLKLINIQRQGDILMIQARDIEHSSLVLRDVLGRDLGITPSSSSSDLSVMDMSSLRPGVYWLEVNHASQSEVHSVWVP